MGFGLLVLTKKKGVNETKTAFRNLDQSIIEDFLARIKDVNLKILKLKLTEQDSLSNSFDSYTVYTELITSEFFIPMRLLGSFFHVAMNGMAAAKNIFTLLESFSNTAILLSNT